MLKMCLYIIQYFYTERTINCVRCIYMGITKKSVIMIKDTLFIWKSNVFVWKNKVFMWKGDGFLWKD